MDICLKKNMPRRISIFAVYDKEGVWGRYRSYIATELKKISNKVIIVVNGYINDEIDTYVCDCNTEVIFRENKGFDAGAYRDVIVNHIGLYRLKQYTDLILCNDTFFGPFTPFLEIFSDMEKSNADFWGLFRSEEKILQNICSCFYVFRLKENLLNDVYTYFENNIHGDTKRISDVYTEYEIGLYIWLVSKQYKSDTYIKNYKYSIYTNIDMALLKFKFPIIKKKFFFMCNNKENVIHALQVIHNTTKYSIDMILEYIDLSIYEIKDVIDIVKYQLQYKKLDTSHTIECNLSKEQLLSYIINSDEIYLYGGGVWSNFIYAIYFNNKNKCKGILITKKRGIHKYIELPIYEYDDSFDSKCVIVAMSFKNTEDLIKKIGKKENWLYLW